MSSPSPTTASDLSTPFLGVEQSARGFTWKDRLAPHQQTIGVAIAQHNNIPEILGRVMASRGASVENSESFLDPSLRDLMPDPHTLQDMEKGATRIARAISDKENIAVFGDYDVDGGTSSALMTRFFAAHDLTNRTYIPDRMKEGYGPNENAIKSLMADGATLVITVDCGISSYQALEVANGTATDVVIIDHHQAEPVLPDVHAVINPNRQDDLSGQGHLCAAGVVFLVMVDIVRILRKQGWYDKNTPAPNLLQWLDLVALATVCDVVPLTGLNRAYVIKGLQVMHNRQNLGLRTLFDVASVNSEPNPYHLGFILGPRINAGGRIGNPGLGAQLLSTNDEKQAQTIALQLDSLNKQRRDMEADMVEEAVSQAERILEEDPDLAMLVVASTDWHKGLVGLVASRLTERFRRPTLAISWTGENEEGTGSARSIAGVDLGAAVRAAMKAHVIIKGGGHAMAAGLTLKEEQFEALKAFLQMEVGAAARGARAAPVLEIDGALTARAATFDFVDLLEKAGPYGSENPQPRFVFPSHSCKNPQIVGTVHVRCSIVAGDNSRLDAIAFRAADTDLGRTLLESNGMPLHIAGQIKRSTWNGREKIEVIIDDVADPRKQNK